MANRPLILITNDDGIASPGLHAVANVVADLGDLLIVAPSAQRTSAGRGYPPVTDKNIYPTEIPFGDSYHPAYKADFSPAQAVLVAVLKLANRPVDLCISGINYGENLGTAVTISGTIGAAIEAACFGIPGLAISLETPHEFHYNYSTKIDFSAAAYFAHYFARQVLTRGLPPGVDILKVDVPTAATPQTPWQVTRLSRQRYWEAVDGGYSRLDKPDKGYEAKIHYEILETDSDIYAFAIEKRVSVVPMTIDMTAPVSLPELAQLLNSNR
jgi:5'-nucleotidase